MSAFLQSIMPAPVILRSFITSAALISIIILSLIKCGYCIHRALLGLCLGGSLDLLGRCFDDLGSSGCSLLSGSLCYGSLFGVDRSLDGLLMRGLPSFLGAPSSSETIPS